MDWQFNNGCFYAPAVKTDDSRQMSERGGGEEEEMLKKTFSNVKNSKNHKWNLELIVYE